MDKTGLPRQPRGKKKTLPMQETEETQIQSLGQEDPLKDEMATNSSILAWEIPRTEDPGRIQSVGSQRGKLSDSTATTNG